MSKVIFTTGLPGSGKSTWSRKFCEKNTDWVRVSRDDIRNMRGRYWLQKDEKLISHWEQELIATALDYKKNVIVDATNFNQKYVKQIKDICKLVDENTQFETKFFDVSLETAIKRDLQRPNSVGEKVIREKYKKYISKIEPIKQDKSLPHAIICDLDGTLAIHNGRSPFEYDKCDTDLPNTIIVSIIENYLNQNAEIFKEEDYKKVIFMSGREDSCRQKTEEWLLSQGFNPIYLYMRKTGDHRKDTIVKKELFDQHVKDKYYVEFVLDDRDQVVEMWRDLGLICLQVAEGDF